MKQFKFFEEPYGSMLENEVSQWFEQKHRAGYNLDIHNLEYSTFIKSDGSNSYSVVITYSLSPKY